MEECESIGTQPGKFMSESSWRTIHAETQSLIIMLIFMPEGWICFHLVRHEEYQNTTNGKDCCVPVVVQHMILSV